ncbi:MAG: hypothetical protein QMD92_00015 [bacterium]|nr:hypothetical protein [bacterium]
MDTLIPATNPFLGVVAYNPATVITALATSLSNFVAFYTSIGNTLTTFKAMWSGWVTTVTGGITSALTTALEISGIPEFEAGMRDINAVQTSSFVLGKSMLYARVGLEAAKLALMNTNQAVDLTMRYGETLRGQLAAQMDYSKIVIIAYKEQLEKQIDIDAEEAKWPFFEFREAGALLGSIGGSAAMQGAGKPNPMASALGGAMAGAATGAAVTAGNPLGALAGAVIGGVGGFLSAQ